MNMNKHILYKKILLIIDLYYDRGKKFDKETIKWLLFLIIYNNPVSDCVIKGKFQDWYGLPKTKSLFYTDIDKGFPIGNLTSQLFANIYLHEFDCYMKQTLGCRYYGRYVDDIVVVQNDIEFLKKAVLKAGEFLQQRLGLTVHPNKTYLQPYQYGVSFLGEFFKPHRRYVAKRTRSSLSGYIYRWNKLVKAQEDVLRKSQIKDFLSGINSYLGGIKYIQSYKLRIKLVGKVRTTFWRYIVLNVSYTAMRIK